MVPIHDTDIAEERWLKGEWENYELWEKVEIRLRRRKRLWIAGTVLLFLLLSSVPVIRDRMPKWTSLAATRRLSQEINILKRNANTERAAFRIRFPADGSLSYQIEKVENCSVTQPGQVIRTGALVSDSQLSKFEVLTSEKGRSIRIPGLVQSFCYDYLAGSEAILRSEPVVGFGIVPVNDLTERGTDRLSVLLLSGPSAEISFD